MKIAELVKDGRVNGIADVRDETCGRTGQRLVIVLKRDAVAKVVLNNLYKHTQLQDNFGANMLALVDGVPRTLTAGPADPVLGRAPDRGHRPAHPSTGCARPRSAPTSCAPAQGARPDRRGHRADPRQRLRVRRAQEGLMELLEIDEVQARAILDMQLRRLAALERQAPHRRVRGPDGEDRGLRGHPGLRRASAPDRRSTSSPRSWTSTATTGAPGSSRSTAT